MFKFLSSLDFKIKAREKYIQPLHWVATVKLWLALTLREPLSCISLPVALEILMLVARCCLKTVQTTASGVVRGWSLFEELRSNLYFISVLNFKDDTWVKQMLCSLMNCLPALFKLCVAYFEIQSPGSPWGSAFWLSS